MAGRISTSPAIRLRAFCSEIITTERSAKKGLERGVALSEDGMEQAGMGVGLGDVNLDGNLDIFKTHFADDTHILYRNDGKGNFDDVTIAQRHRCGYAVYRLGHGHRRSRQ